MSEWIDLLRRQRNLALLLISGLLAPLITNLASSWMEQTWGQTTAQLAQLVALLLAAMVALGALALALRTRPQDVALVSRDAQPPRCRGLIALVGPGRRDDDPMQQAAVRAIEYHLADKGDLQVCWLIASSGEGGSVPVAERIRRAYEERCQIFIREVGNAFAVQQTYDVVRRIYERELDSAGQERDVARGEVEWARLLHLRRVLATRFNKSELRTLCFGLGIAHERLPGETIQDMALELLNYCDRRRRVDQLVEIGQRMRPDVSWEPDAAPPLARGGATETPSPPEGITLRPEQVMADFTGGTKPMTAGMVLACGHDRPMQYTTGYKPGIASTPLLVQFQPAQRQKRR